MPSMMLAPTPHLTGYSAPMRSGYPGILQTLAQMRAMVRECRKNPVIRQAATSTIFLTPEKDEWHETEAIFNLVRDSVRYVRDVFDVETLSTPMATLAGRIGDCDDQIMLLAAMLESVGYPTRFVIEGYSNPDVFEHVYLQSLIAGQWVSMDPTEPYLMGWSPPDFICQQVENI